MSETAEPTAADLPAGEYAIVELFGHQTLVGRVQEVERFGTKMLALEPLFQNKLLEAVLHGGAAIYRMTPCSPEIAWKQQPRKEWQLPASIRVTVPIALLTSEPAIDAIPDFDPDPDDFDLNDNLAMNEDPGI